MDVSEVGGAHPALALQAVRLVFTAREGILFPDGLASNVFRGAFGTIFRRLVCVPECESAATCPRQQQCPYARMFEPLQNGKGPSGFRNWPRPFVFRGNHLNGTQVEAGQNFHLDVHLFDLKRPSEQHVIAAFAELAEDGLGRGRKKVELLRTEQRAISMPLSSETLSIEKISVQFVTPTELKEYGELVPQPEFRVLAARARDRVSTLCELYGDGAPDIDFKSFGERAAIVRMTHCDVHPIVVSRRSTRTGQVHAIGGFVGEAEYQGDLAEFVPWLKAAYWTGVGRQTVWGKGVIETRDHGSSSGTS